MSTSGGHGSPSTFLEDTRHSLGAWRHSSLLLLLLLPFLPPMSTFATAHSTKRRSRRRINCSCPSRHEIGALLPYIGRHNSDVEVPVLAGGSQSLFFNAITKRSLPLFVVLEWDGVGKPFPHAFTVWHSFCVPQVAAAHVHPDNEGEILSDVCCLTSSI